jgi:hypothetical protein
MKDIYIELMDTNQINRTPDLSKARERILAIVDEKHGAYLSDLLDGSQDIDAWTIRLALRSLLKDRTLRQKEDEIEHDWEYVRRRE